MNFNLGSRARYGDRDEPSLSDDDMDGSKSDEENGKHLQNVLNLCGKSSGLMATMTTFRSTLQTNKKAECDEGDDEVGVSRGREWGQIEPLTLQVLGEALAEQQPQLTPLTHANASHTCAHVTSLSLQFKGLGSLDFLWMMGQLTTLELSNNSLTSTRGLEKLTHLVWLDLSFNQIRRIIGLQSLRKLEVLALHNNCVERLERGALQPLASLQVLTLSKNNIGDINDVGSLRQLGQLASLSLAHNPLCDARYPAYVLAHLPNLAYLDHRRVTPEDHAKATDQYRSEVSGVALQEAKVLQQEEEEALTRGAQEEHRQAGVLALNDGSLFVRMFRGDKDMGVLLQLPGAHALMTKYRDQFNAVCVRVFNAGLDHEVQRQEELQLLHAALNAAKNDADAHARGVVRRLEADVKAVVAAGRELRAAEEASIGDDQEAHEARLAKSLALQEQFEDTLGEATHELLDAEVTLADQIKDVVDRGREELGALVGSFLEEATTELQEGRRLAYTFYCRLRELTSKVRPDDLTRGASPTPPSGEEGGQLSQVDEGAGVPEGRGMDEERAARVFEGADTLAAALAGIHDRHLALIDSREADLRHHLKQWLKDTLQGIARVEWSRHRSRVEEITTLLARQRQLLYDALPTMHDQ
ncbi:dynein regulatory complex subunit 3-like isoform X1 [Panulirus ornatus]|uniref:dynein regulatory complex subunit 3-like isoform X1 n=1 Tax=Panulirus ornatus TaxID=150431 RepID=UPI003A84D2B3